MKFKVTMNDPDTLHDCVLDAAKDSVADIADPEERAAVQAVRRDRMLKAAKPWFEYGEYLTVEIDTDAGTCVVVPARC